MRKSHLENKGERVGPGKWNRVCPCSCYLKKTSLKIMTEIIHQKLHIPNFALLTDKGYMEEFNSSNCNTKK